mmetsp:Transcript_99478/g.257105  ORF Transcript_99478/g.257105 Transcript_99478/m.257105 type:complete len:219 (-) Transcript_99478:1196-1852(-)
MAPPWLPRKTGLARCPAPLCTIRACLGPVGQLGPWPKGAPTHRHLESRSGVAHGCITKSGAHCDYGPCRIAERALCESRLCAKQFLCEARGLAETEPLWGDQSLQSSRRGTARDSGRTSLMALHGTEGRTPASGHMAWVASSHRTPLPASSPPSRRRQASPAQTGCAGVRPCRRWPKAPQAWQPRLARRQCLRCGLRTGSRIAAGTPALPCIRTAPGT